MVFPLFHVPTAPLRRAWHGGRATELGAAISVGRTVLNPKMNGRYVTERARKFLIYRTRGEGERREKGRDGGDSTSPYFCRPHSALRKRRSHFLSGMWPIF